MAVRRNRQFSLAVIVMMTLCDTAHAFFVTPTLRVPRAARRLSPLCYKPPSQSRENSEHDNDTLLKSTSSTTWTMKEDWALMDQLPKFTIGEDKNQVRTFWTQLATSTPLLSHREPDELYQRCQVLQQDHSLLLFGPSPPLLSKWRLDLTSRSTDNRAVGTLEDGRVVWLHYHVVGRLPGDLFSDSSSPSLMALIPGGYLEAVGGRIYELGEPSSSSSIGVATETMSIGKGFWTDPVVAKAAEDTTPSEEKSMAWWLPATTGTVSALLASTVLSACIGYGAGLGIIADQTMSTTDANPHHATTHPQTMRPASSTTRISPQMIHYKTSSSSYNTPSLEERMARAEYKVLREERLLKKIAEELERDRADLHGLQRIQLWEQQEGGASSQLLP